MTFLLGQLRACRYQRGGMDEQLNVIRIRVFYCDLGGLDYDSNSILQAVHFVR
ncbi:MAG TPA: hypothetical protein VHW09_01230 [Bryobacteraceae bacterium]|nr:hypothetical protein [Bryobacteraceae bacterium]